MRRSAILFCCLLGSCAEAGLVESGGEPIRLQEVMRFGGVEGEGALTSIAALARTDSTLLVLDQTPPRVSVFDLTGPWVRDIGGQGNGPGEFQSPAFLGLSADQVWVGDPRGGRLEVFSMAGRPVRSYRWEIAADDLGAGAYPMALLSDGSVLAGPGRGTSSENATHRSYYKASDDGSVVSLLYRQELRTDLSSASLPSGQLLVGWHPIGESSLVAAYPDGTGLVAVERPQADGPEEALFDIRIVDGSGRIEASWAVPYHPIPAEGWLEDYLEYAAEVQQEQLGRVLHEVLEAAETMYAERSFYPPATDLKGGIDGSVWVRREHTEGDSVRWQVFTRSGEEVGLAVLHSELDLLLVSLDEVWAVETDDLGVPYVVRMRVVESRD